MRERQKLQINRAEHRKNERDKYEKEMKERQKIIRKTKLNFIKEGEKERDRERIKGGKEIKRREFK